MIKETLKVTGMHCPKCTARVEKTVGAIDGVESVAADFEADKVELAYDGQPFHARRREGRHRRRGLRRRGLTPALFAFKMPAARSRRRFAPVITILNSIY